MEVLEGKSFKDFGSVVIGEQGKLFFNRGSGAKWVLKTQDSIDGFQWPQESIPRATGQNNYQEWMDTITGKVEQGQSNFELAGQLTETNLLGVRHSEFPTRSWHGRPTS